LREAFFGDEAIPIINSIFFKALYPGEREPPCMTYVYVINAGDGGKPVRGSRKYF
jgi:hypothetical protein